MTQRHGLSVPCDALLDEFEQQSLAPPGSVVYTARLKLITPALLGGFDPRKPDAFTPIRDKALRGQLRGWWRMLALAGDFDGLNLPGTPLKGDAGKVRAREFALWGALGDGESALPSAIGISVAIPATQARRFQPYALWQYVERSGRDEWVPQPPFQPPTGPPYFHSVDYALHFAKGPAEGNGTVPARELCREGLSFDVELSIADQAWATTVLLALQYWAMFGGVGGRTSRGIGAVTLEALTCDGKPCTLAPWPQGCLDSQGRFTSAALKGVIVFKEPGKPPFTGALGALEWGTKQLAGFLQRDNGLARNHHRGMSLWPEARLVRKRTVRWYGHMSAVHEFHDKHHPDSNPKKLPGGQPIGAFAPRLAFGHRTYRFAPSQTTRASDEGFYPDPAPHALAPIGSDRLPSSLIVRPVVWIDQNGRKRVGCALIQRNAMAGVALPAATLRREGSTTIVQGEALMAWNPAWIAGKTKGCANITALEDPRCASGAFDHPADAAQAFVNFVFNTVYPGGVVPPGGAVP